mmetsp:Transcript_4507/g.13348  ORF Transcript_4507/g.13348 Transcript_4507/m.13348 type:complete len:408 (-) Transcript_4507:120-1343(-)
MTTTAMRVMGPEKVSRVKRSHGRGTCRRGDRSRVVFRQRQAGWARWRPGVERRREVAGCEGWRSLVCHATPSSTALGESSLFKKADISAEHFEDARNKENWDKLAQVLSSKLDIEVDSPRIQHYYLPVYMWIKAKMREHKEATSYSSSSEEAGPPLCVGLSAPQGCGKTTLVTAFEELFDSEGLTCVSMSLDDFYLTRREQVALAESHSENELLQVRGNAGTHDVDLAMSLIESVKSGTRTEIKVPCYDKTAFEGKGDRHEESKWRTYDASKVDVVLYEGWMQGFTSVGDDSKLGEVHSGIPEVNKYLDRYAEMWSLMDIWLIIQVKQLDCIYSWRLQAEKAMKQAFGEDKGMTDEEVKAFVDKYIPAYKAYLPDLYDADKHMDNLGCKSQDDVFMFEVDATRSPVE